MSAPIEISNGRDTVKIYTSTTRGKPLFQLSFYRAGLRERRSFVNKARAKREAKTILCQLASLAAATDKAITTTDIESLVAARAALAEIAIPIHLVAEGFAEAIRQLGMPGDPLAALNRAISFYVKHHPNGSTRITVGEMMRMYLESRERRGLSKGWIKSVGGAIRSLLKQFSAEACDLPSGEEIAGWLQKKYQSPVTKNSVLKIIKAFTSWAKKQNLVSGETITRVECWREPASEVKIYTPEELRLILNQVSPLAIPFVAIGAFAGLRASETIQLDWSEIDLARGHIVVAASKAKTAARRLAPVHENLKAWLEPYAQPSGPVVLLSDSRINQFLRASNLPRKRNALRHSYISYRLAEINDTPRVALECGNSPTMIFKHYREIVTEEDAKAWFSLMPG